MTSGTFAERRVPAATFSAVILDAAQRWPDAEALVMPTMRRTFSAMADRALAVAGALTTAGVRRGDPIGLVKTDGTPEHLELVLGAALTGVVPILFNDVTEQSHLRALMAELQPRLVFTTAPEHLGEVGVPTILINGKSPRSSGALHGYDAFVAAGEAWSVARAVKEAASITPDDVLVVLFTSAVTTGVPKTCALSQRDFLDKTDSFCNRVKLRAGSRIWIPMHMFQVGFISPWVIAFAIGATVLAVERFDADVTLQLLRKERVTHAYPAYPRYWLPLVYHLDFFPSDFAELTHVVLIGPLALLKRLQRLMPQSTLMNTYGGAELGGTPCMPFDDDPAELRLGAVGRPFNGYHFRIIDPRDGSPCGHGEVGEIQMFHAGSPVAQNTFSSLYTQDGWLQTSDLGSMSPDGVLYYHGRLSEMLSVSGTNISATSIEAVLSEHPGVSVAQVIGVDDAAAGQVPAAFVQLRPGYFSDAAEILEHCVGKLPDPCIPRTVTFINEWPMSASKIQKARLIELPEYQAGGASV